MIGLRYIRGKKGMSIEEVCTLVDLKRSSGSNWESGRNLIPDMHLETLSSLFGIPKNLIQDELTEENRNEIDRILLHK